jgi:hypothetical protein
MYQVHPARLRKTRMGAQSQPDAAQDTENLDAAALMLIHDAESVARQLAFETGPTVERINRLDDVRTFAKKARKKLRTAGSEPSELVLGETRVLVNLARDLLKLASMQQPDEGPADLQRG